MAQPIDGGVIETATTFRLDESSFLGLVAAGLGLPDGGKVAMVTPRQGDQLRFVFLTGLPAGSRFERDERGIVRWAPPTTQATP